MRTIVVSFLEGEQPKDRPSGQSGPSLLASGSSSRRSTRPPGPFGARQRSERRPNAA